MEQSDQGSLNIPVYIVNYKNEGRRQRMKSRFNHFGIEPIFTQEVEGTDPRLSTAPEDSKRVWAVMLQHLDSIRHYIETSDSQYCIICEDDIHITNTFVQDIQELIPVVDQMQLDVLLLGYLLPFKIDMSTYLHQQYFPIVTKTERFSLHRYPDDIWGCQMYLFPRRYADVMLDLYTIDYAITNVGTINYNPDWTLTKNGHRLLVSPMVAVEEGINVSGNESQMSYHIQCHMMNYDASKYI